MTRFLYAEDPRVAGEELENFAIKNSYDLDWVMPAPFTFPGPKEGYNPFSIRIVGNIVPTQVADAGFRENLARLTREDKQDSLLICIFEKNRNLPLRETIALLKSGIRFYCQISEYAYLVRLSAARAQELLSAPYLAWIGEYKSTYKFPPVEGLPPTTRSYVSSFEGDRPEFRADLQRLGIVVLDYYESTKEYNVLAGRDRYAEIARLWWVKDLSTAENVQVPEYKNP